MAEQLTAMGLDTSLTSTGISTAWGGVLAPPPEFRSLCAPKGLKTWARMEWLIKELGAYVKQNDPDVILIEGPGYHSASRGAYWHENAGFWWEVTLRIKRSGRPLVVITPGTLKKFATGRGNADKGDMRLAAGRRFDLDRIGDDEADALWLAAAGLERYGWPLVSLPAAQVAALDAIKDWPALPLAA